ncbi:MAG: ATP phosphoribosyltransferase [Rubricoccaceae bacterium]|nr:ATP phosphoribosyltransferase [Rubricoccaceae bacterium]
MTPLTLALQKDGRLSDQSLLFLRECGLDASPGPRSLTAACAGFPLELLFLRAKDIPEVVADGGADLGLCGQDVLSERGDDALRPLASLGFGRCRLSIAAPTPLNLDGTRIATSFPRTLGRWLDETGVRAEVVTLSGSVEIAPRLGIADAICDLVSTGSTLAQHGLKELETVLRSEAVLFANGLADEGRRATLDALLLRVNARLAAQRTRYVVMNAPASAVETIRALLPGLKTPTVSELAEPGWVSIATVVGVDVFWETMQRLKEAGASDVLVMPIEQLIQ